jgi:hypothetical protein
VFYFSPYIYIYRSPRILHGNFTMLQLRHRGGQHAKLLSEHEDKLNFASLAQQKLVGIVSNIVY